MNLKKLFSWNSSPKSSADGETPTGYETSNVIPIGSGNPLSEPAGLIDLPEEGNIFKSQTMGIFELPEIQRFLGLNHFGHGRHCGALYKSLKNLEDGRQEKIAIFQNILTGIYESKRKKIQKLEIQGVEIKGACDIAEAMLLEVKRCMTSDLDLLRTQIELAKDGQGWVLAALIAYQNGFIKGLREALEFDLI